MDIFVDILLHFCITYLKKGCSLKWPIIYKNFNKWKKHTKKNTLQLLYASQPDSESVAYSILR